MADPICESCHKPIENARWGYRAVVHPKTHDARYKPSCLCCSCRRMRRTYADPRVEIMERGELSAVLAAAKRGKPWAYFAFRIAVNAMMTAREISCLRRLDIVDAVPCRIKVAGSDVPLECGTIEALDSWVGSRTGRVFPFHEKMIRREFAASVKESGVDRYGFVSLRFTGISLRARAVRSYADLLALKRASRVHKWDDLDRYGPPTGFMDWMKRIAWAK